MALAKISNFFRENKKIIFYFLVFISIFSFLGDSTSACTGTGCTGGSDDDEAIKALNSIFYMISGLLAIMTQLISALLNPGWISGSVVGLSTILKDLWILVSNVVYFAFAFILIFIAFMNIIGRGQEKYQLKKSLPKLFFGIIIVPFTWFLINLLISFSSILAASVMSLPFDSLGNARMDNYLKETKICTYYEITKKDTKCKGDTEDKKNTNSEYYKDLETLMSGNGIYSLTMLYTYGIFEADKFTKTFKEDAKGNIKNLLDLTIDKLFHIVLIIVYFVLLIALGLALFTRVIWLWLFMIFSPAFGLLYFFDKTDMLDGKFSIKNLINLILVPVYVGAALSFGFLFIVVSGFEIKSEGGAEFSSNGIIDIEAGNLGGETSSKLHLLEGHSKGGYTVEHVGGVLGGSNPDDESNSNNVNSIKGIFGSMIAQLFGLAILWIGVLSALRANDITKTVVDPLYEFGKQAGGLIAKSPQFAPIFPGGQSMKSLQNIGSQVGSTIESQQTTRATDFLSKTPFGQNASKIGELDKLNKKIVGYQASVRDVIPAVQEVVQKAGDFDQLRTISQSREAIFNALNQIPGGKAALDKIGVKSSGDLLNAEKMSDALSELDRIAQESGFNLFEEEYGLIANVGGAKGAVDRLAKGSRPTKSSLSIDVSYHDEARDKPSLLSIGEERVQLDQSGKIIEADIDNFARALVGYSESEILRKMDQKGITQTMFTALFEQVKNEVEVKNGVYVSKGGETTETDSDETT